MRQDEDPCDRKEGNRSGNGGDEGIEERRVFRTRARLWSDMRRVQVGQGAALVSPFARPNWMDRYRAITLLFDGADRQQVVSILEQQVVVGDQ